MPSIVSGIKKQLEERGEYVILTNLDTGWFAVNPGTLKTRELQAANDGREGPTFIVYKTISENPRDHYSIPYSIVRELLNENTLKLQKNGSYRWNLTLKNGLLHVSHRKGSIDVNAYHGALFWFTQNRTSGPVELAST